MNTELSTKIESVLENYGSETVLNEMFEWFSTDEAEELVNKFLKIYESEVYKKVERIIKSYGADTVANEMFSLMPSKEAENFINRFLSLYN